MKQAFLSWQVWAFLSAIFAALTAIMAKCGVSNLPPDFATFVRTCVVIIMLCVIVSVTGQWQPLSKLAGRGGVFLLLSGLATGASWLCYFRALKMGDAARVAPIDKLSVVFVAVLSACFLGERLSILSWLGVVLIAGGAVLIACQ